MGVQQYVDSWHREAPPGPFFPVFGRAKTEFRASFRGFPYAPRPSRAVLVDLLSRFHRKVAPIVAARVALW
jgi:hypothetical protein